MGQSGTGEPEEPDVVESGVHGSGVAASTQAGPADLAVERDLAAEIAAAWRRERPGTPVSSIGIVSRVWALAKLFGENRRRVLAAAGVDAATLDLLSTLRRSGSPYTLTTREITTRTLVTAGAISQRIARAERDGLVVRCRAVGPSRAVWVDLTPRGHAVVDRTVDHVLGQEVELLDALDDDQQASLAELLRILMQDVRRRYGDVPPTHVGT